MVAVVAPSQEEMYLLAILEAADGLDLAEFCWFDAESDDGCYRAWDFQWCLGGETVVLTNRGRTPIGNLVGQEDVQVLTVDEKGQSSWVPAKFESFGRRRLWDVTLTRDGITKTIRSTNVHEWMVSYERQAERRHFRRVATQDLQPGAYMQVADPPSQPLKLDRVGVQRGVVWGDGTHIRNWSGDPSSARVNLWGGKRALTDWFDVDPREITNRLDVAVPGYYMSPMPAHFKLSPVDLAETASMRWGWLAGYFATDGSVAKTDGQCTMSSARWENLQHVRDVATSLGVGTSSIRLGGDGYVVTLYVSHLSRDFFINPGHAQHFREGRKHRRTAAWRVTSVEPTDSIDEVFCATISGTHNFVLDDDLVTGNCWYTDNSMYQIDQGGRALGKTVGIKMRAFAFPFAYTGQSMLLTAPELNHLRPLTDVIEQQLLTTRLMAEMLPDGKGKGIARQPHWQCRFRNGTMIISRLPNKDGKGVKGMHVINIEMDEAQDYPKPGWVEIVETLNRFLPGAMFRCHGVSKGIRDDFFDKSQPDSGWKTHRPMAMNRPTWGADEREEKIKAYGGSRQAINYRRNIYGEHGDAANSVFVLARLMDCVDLDEASIYNQDIYTKVMLEFERFPPGAEEDERLAYITSWIDLPGTHKHGYSMKVGGREVGAPKGYSAYYGGMDVGVTNHPSEILIFGQRTGTDILECLTRIQMHRINTDDQKYVVAAMFAFYGSKLTFGIDKTGVGFPIWDQLTRAPFGNRIHGYGFSEKRVAAIEDRPLTGKETIKDLAIMRNVVEASTDWLRSDYVDAKRLRLPYDREILIEFQGQTVVETRDKSDPYGGTRKIYSGGSFHTLDAAKMMIAAKHIPILEEMLEAVPDQGSVLDVFVGM